MVRKFKCWDCGRIFQADDQDKVKCPHCQSDNIDFYSLHIPYKKILLGIAVFVVLGLSAYLILQKITSNSTLNNDEIVISDGETDTIPQQVTKEAENAYMNETGLKLPPSITPIGKKTLNDDDNTYSFKVTIENPPSTSFKIVLTDKITGKTIAESRDGSFTGVPPSKADGGIYIIKIVDGKTDSVLCTPQTMDGFLPVQKVDHKLSVAQFQQLIDSEDETLIGDGENPYLAPGYTIKYTGLSNDDSHPTNLADVLEKVDMGVWSSVKVESMEYDDTKHIKTITLHITK